MATTENIIELLVPSLPESVADALIAVWHKEIGQAVKRDDNLVDLETDKVVLEVPAPADGYLVEIIQAEGETVTSKQLLARYALGEAPGESAAPAASASAAPAASESSAELLINPAARLLIDNNSLDASQITGSGKGGRIIKEDVVSYMGRNQTAAPAAAPKPAAAPAPSSTPAPASPMNNSGRTEQRVPMTRLRARIAERLVEAQHTAAMLTTFNEVNLKAVMDLRARHKKDFEAAHGARLGFMSFFVKACVDALKRYPAINATLDGTDVVYHDYFDIGIAVSSPRGLVVPILRDVDTLSMAEVEKGIGEYGAKAQAGKLSLDELTGGTFSITNGGVFGSMVSTPILNPPQSAILGMHSITDRPMVEDGEIVIRPMMYLALTYDHRLIDGKEAVQFLVAIKNALEDPARLLLQI